MTRTPTMPLTAGAPQDADAPGDVFARISEAAWRCGAAPEFRRACCDAIARHFGAAAAVLEVGSGDAGSRQEAGDPDEIRRWARGIDAEMLKANAREAAVGRLYESPGGEAGVMIAAAPIEGIEGGAAIAAVIPCADRAQAPARLAELRSIAAHVANAVEIFDLRPRLATRADDAGTLVARAASSRSFSAFAYEVANGLRARLDCEQVSIGVVLRDRARVACVSGLDVAKKNAPGARLIQQAMEECADLGREVVCGLEGASDDAPVVGPGRRLHETWRRASHSGAVASFPLHADGTVVGVLSLRMPGGRSFGRHEVELIRAMVAPVGPTLALLRRATRGPLERARDDTARLARWMASPGSLGGKLVLIAGVTLAAWFLFGTMTYRVGVEGVVSSEGMRVISAPMDGRLLTCRVQAGDRVEAGDVLATLDTRDLELERRQLEAERRVLDVELAKASDARDLAAASLASAQRDLVLTRLEGVRSRLERAVIRAPEAGLVIRGDLAERVGAALPVGEAMFELAPTGSLGVRLRVPQHAVDELAPGLDAVFVTHAEPDRPIPCVLGPIPPGTEIRDGRSVFVVEAVIERGHAVRVGMEGVGRIDAGPRPVWWVALHRVIDAIRMEL
jgi:multidrug resistance efflux pump